MADDLRHWLEGEPIQTRPLGPAERLYRWGRREPVLAPSAVTTVLCLFAAVAVAMTGTARSARLAHSAAAARRTAEEGQRTEAEARQRAESAEGTESEARRKEEEQRNELAAALERTKKAKQAAVAARQKEEAQATRLREAIAQLERERQAEVAARMEEEEQGKRLQAQLQESVKTPLQTILLPAKQQSNVLFSPDGGQVVLGSGPNVIVWETTGGKEVTNVGGHTGAITGVAVSTDGQRLVSVGEDGTMKVWDYPARKLIATYTKGARRSSGLALSPDGQHVAAAYGLRLVSAQGEVLLWNVATGQEKSQLKRHTGPVVGVTFSPDGKTVASASWDETVKLWDVNTGKLVRTLTGHKGKVYFVAFRPDGQRLASAGGEIKIWDPATGKELLSFPGRRTVAFSADGQRLATATGIDVLLRDVSDGRLLFTYHAASGDVLGIAFSPDGNRLASVHADGTVRIWNSAPLQEPPTKAVPPPGQ